MHAQRLRATASLERHQARRSTDPLRASDEQLCCRNRGFSNVGYNNGPNPEPRTPHIDALHGSGAELTNYYVYRFCSPTRSSFMS